MNRFIAVIVFLAGNLYAEQSTYENPVNGKSYSADWKIYSPQKPAPEIPKYVQMEGARLLTEQAIFAENIKVDVLSDFIKATQSNIQTSVGKPSSDFSLLIQTTLSKDQKPKFEIASKGDVSKEALQKISDGFSSLPDLRSKTDSLVYQVQFSIHKEAQQDAAARSYLKID
jgi:hypothetical protein